MYMCSLTALLSFVECHASKNSLLFHWEHFNCLKLSHSQSPNQVLSAVCASSKGGFS